MALIKAVLIKVGTITLKYNAQNQCDVICFLVPRSIYASLLWSRYTCHTYISELIPQLIGHILVIQINFNVKILSHDHDLVAISYLFPGFITVTS